MALININSFNYKSTNSDLEITFNLKHNQQKLPSFFRLSELDNNKIKKNIIIHDFLGEGSYGIVYKISIDDKYYAIKLSENEISEKLIQRYKSLCQNDKLKKHIIKIYCCGEIKKIKDQFKYYCIMEYGGKTLKSMINKINIYELKSILKQLYNIIYQSSKLRLLITDFKLGNLTITTKNKVKLIDIYMECENYNPCINCRIVKTYSTIELDKEKRIYENLNYNYTGIYIPFAVCLIELICKHSMSYYTNKICNKFNIDLTVKQIMIILQIASYNYQNENNDRIKKYTNINKFKKNLESEYKFLKTNDFYIYFLNLLEPKNDYEIFINKKILSNILNDLLTLDPEQRSLKHLKAKLLNNTSII